MSATTSPLSDAHELCRLGVEGLAELYASGALSPLEVATATLERADAINPLFNAFTFIDRDGAMEAARASEARWRERRPLSRIDGVPTTLKDIVSVAGWTVRYGSRTTDASPCREDAPAVESLRRAGAIFIGQTTTPEFGWKAVTDSALNGITRNPWNATMTPGGSSGGAAVAAATGAGVLHLGTDGGGSIRIPAAFTGIVGLKPTFGRVPAYPASAFGTVAHIGPMARRASDAAAMLVPMEGRDLRDWAQGPGRLDDLSTGAGRLAGARIGYCSKPPCGSLDREVAAVVAATVRRLEAIGAWIEPIELPRYDLLDIFNKHWFSGAANRLDAVPEDQRVHVDPGLIEAAAIGATFSARDLAAAQALRAQFGAKMDQLLVQYDLLLSPATTVPAFEAGRDSPSTGPFNRWIEWAAFSFPFNLSQQPACVVPCGKTEGGLPIGLQIVGARGADARVLSAAAQFEQILPEHFL
jgi:amidase/aspartyl-tRNA(Asn)/glutamyl-tRNA(Gln) amidotransferase subunit A